MPDLRSSVLPLHDSRQSMSAFHALYAAIYHEGELPLWLPYGRYGTPATLFMMYLSPMTFVVAVLGKIFSVYNTFFLYKLAIFSELLILTAGTWALTRELFRFAETRLMVTAGTVLSFSWLFNPSTNLHAYYLLPLIFLYLIRFFNSGRVGNLLAAGTLCAFNVVGNSPYFGPLLALMITVFCVVLYVQNPLRPRDLKFAWSNIGLGILFVGVAAAFVLFMSHGFEGLTSFSQGRDPITSRVYKNIFVTYAGVSKFSTLFLEFITGAHTFGDNTFYIGLLPLVLAAIAVVKCSTREFRAVAALTLLLVLFSFGGPTASLLYHFPTMAFYRHIGLVFGPVKYLLLLMAGFGLESLLSGQASPVRFSLKTHIGKIYALCAVWVGIEAYRSYFSKTPGFQYVLFPRVDLTSLPALWPFFARGLWYGVWAATAFVFYRRTRRGIVFLNFLLFAFIGDVASFKVDILRNSPTVKATEATMARAAAVPEPPQFQMSRAAIGTLELTTPALLVWANLPMREGVATYSHLYSALDLDPCFPLYRTDHLSKHVATLFNARKVNFSVNPTTGAFPSGDEWLKRALGCDHRKLRLVSAEQWVVVPEKDEQDGVKRLSVTDSRFAILSDEAVLPSHGEGGTATAAGTVAVSSFGKNHLSAQVFVPGSAPSYLYYADAFHPGWRAWIDGKPAPILRANVAFKAIVLPPGNHSVQLRFFDGLGSIAFYVLFFASLGFAAWFAGSYIVVPFLGETNGLPELRTRHA